MSRSTLTPYRRHQMIHATHPGELSHIETIASYWWAEYVGAGRPG